jgi:hypothetical protein
MEDKKCKETFYLLQVTFPGSTAGFGLWQSHPFGATKANRIYRQIQTCFADLTYVKALPASLKPMLSRRLSITKSLFFDILYLFEERWNIYLPKADYRQRGYLDNNFSLNSFNKCS